jgi:3-hydroxymyristoyl/3-hydroxydecanoyl-(acyl carrier protein) dehydratase
MTSGPSPSPVGSASPSLAERWTVPTDHPAFAGHFPGRPMVPGVVLLDRVVLLVAEATGHAPETLTLRSVKFLSPVLPGETVVFAQRVAASGAIVFDIFAEGSVDRRPVASGSFVPQGLSGEVAD